MKSMPRGEFRQWVLLAASASMVGCELSGLFAHSLSSPEVSARFNLEDCPTVVLVDDPTNQFGNPMSSNVLAARVGFELRRSGTISNTISPDRVQRLAATNGVDFERMPVDRIGLEVEAKQVIHIHVASVQWRQDPGLWHPTAEVRVKVIDVDAGRRIFPSATSGPNAPDLVISEVGERVNVEMSYRAPSMTPRSDAMLMGRDLANQIGLAVAQLFYDHEPE